MKRALLGAIAAAVLLYQASPALAVTSTISIPSRVQTFSAVITGLAPAATATDFFTLTGSPSMVVRIKHAYCTGTASVTGAAVDTVLGVVRSAADTGGTSTTLTAVPNDSQNAVATAVARAYTANPTVGAAIGNVRVGNLGLSYQTTVEPPLDWAFAQGQNDQEITLRGAGQVFALNNAGATMPNTPSLSCYVEWTESGS